MATQKNPLAQAFGMALRRQRDFLGRSSSEIAISIDIGESYYRLVESGTNNLHISKAIPLIDAFEGKLDFDGISKILMAISYMEASGKRAIENTHYAEGLKGAAEKLSIYDENKLRPLLENFSDNQLFEKVKNVTSDAIASEISSLELDTLVRDFITSYETFGRSNQQVQNDYLLRSLNEVPSIYFDFVLDSVRNLKQLPLYVGYAALWQWEDKNRQDFKEMICLTNKPESVASIENLRRYKYQHLWEKRFKEARFIFLADKPSSEIKSDFTRFLKQSLEEDNDQEKIDKFDPAVDKVKFKSLYSNDSLFEKATNLLMGSDYANAKNSIAYDAIWIFTLKDNESVGFIAEIDYKSETHKNQLIHVASLTYSQVNEKIKLLNRIWEKLS